MSDFQYPRSAKALEEKTEGLSVGYLCLDSEGRFLEINQPGARILESESRELIGRSFYEYVSRQDIKILNLYLHKAFKEKDRSACEIRMPNKLGQMTHAILMGACTEDPEGRAVCRSEILDITDRILAEERFRLFAETSLDIVYQLDSNGILLYCSPSVKSILGYTPGEMEGTSFEDYFTPADIPRARQVFKRLLSSKKLRSFVIDVVAKDGRPVPVEFNVTPLVRNEKTVSLFGSGRDITQRKQREQALKTERMRLQGIIEQLPEGVVIAEAPSGKLVLANKNFSKMWGHGFIASHEIDGYAAYKGFHPNGKPYQPRDWPLVRSLGGRKTVSNEEIRIQRADGSFMWVSANSAPLLDESGRLWGAVATMADISQRRQLEQELTESRDNLQYEVEKRTAELSRANEQLETEVAKRKRFESDLKSASEKILRESKRRAYLSARLVETLERDRRDVAMYLHDQINQMLATLKMDLESTRNAPGPETGLYRSKLQEFEEKIALVMAHVKDVSTRLRPDVLDTLGLIPAFRSLIGSFEDDHGLRIHFHFNEPFRKTDPDVSLTLYRIAQEAINNTVKHAQATEVFVDLLSRKNEFQLTVEDNGIGFDMDALKNDATGRGPLGIMIMQERALLAGGELTVESEVGKGTMVNVEIPV